MDAVTFALAKKYTDSVSLNGVAIRYPRINPTTKHWEVFDSASNSFIDTGVVAEGSADIQSISNAEIQNILNNL